MSTDFNNKLPVIQHIETAKIAIVASQYNRAIVSRLSDVATDTLKEQGITDDNLTFIKVPGAFEIPVAVKQLLQLEKFDVIITLGVIIRGETPHFDYIAQQCSAGIMQLSITAGIPIIFGVLTTDTLEQAQNRASPVRENNKGYEAACTALQMLGLSKR